MARKMILVPIEKYEGGFQNTETEALDTHVILSAIPKNYKRRAEALLNHITADPQHRLQWNSQGELIYHGKTIHGSHITDLIKNSQRPYRKQPAGEEEFQRGLQELNIPIGLVTRGTADQNVPSKLNWATMY